MAQLCHSCHTVPAAQLREMIARGEYRPDAPFTTQREICERFEVSMGTAVRALNELDQEGVLVRRRGRGTFVAEAAMGTGAVPGPAPGRAAAPALPGRGRSPGRPDAAEGKRKRTRELGERFGLRGAAELG
ncbi:GntR family transcriptional regulator [Streptomyces sp. NPDC052309]|uniref:winged helix-turn-helix domain-containing protein n=1 Tax=Streptomyces sp. NPDC052309 TaxID=3155421 RepID=UPI00342314C1